MCFINSVVHAWVLPTIYHSICLTPGKKITNFVDKHDVPDERIRNRLLLVRNLYLGKTPDEPGDPLFDYFLWPIPSLERLLTLCTELCSLTFLYPDQDLWSRFQPLLPSRLDKVTLGPMHNSLNSKIVQTHPPITYFTSIHTHLMGDEVENLAMYPTIEKVRKLYGVGGSASLWAVTQVARPEHIKEYHIVICGRSNYNNPIYARAKKSMEELGLNEDPRVTLYQDPISENWIELVYGEFMDCRRRFIDSF